MHISSIVIEQVIKYLLLTPVVHVCVWCCWHGHMMLYALSHQIVYVYAAIFVAAIELVTL